MTKLPTLTLYTRPGCHLCEQAEHHLNLLEFSIKAVNVDSSPELCAQYGDQIPVLTLNGRTLAKGSMSKNRLSLLKVQLIREMEAGQ